MATLHSPKYPGGRLAELYGGKWVLGLGILVTAVFTLLTPIAANTNFGLLIAVRVIEGEGGKDFCPLSLQGDTSRCSLGSVDIKKVAF